MGEDQTTWAPGAEERHDSDEHRAAVVAGVDGSAADAAVTDWACDLAARKQRPLKLVHVVEPGYQLTPYEAVLGELPALSDQLRRAGRAVVAAAADRARARHPDLEVEQLVEWGPPAAALVDLSDEAAWVVVGAPARSRLERVFLGSVALVVVAHATCAVAVVPSTHEVTPPNRVVVGVDGSRCSQHAVEVALRAAEPVGGTVTCVVGWTVEVSDGVVVTEPGTDRWNQVEDRYRSLVHDTIDGIVATHPDAAVEIVVRAGGPSRAILEVAAERDADLVVVGSRGRGGFAGLLLGSVSRRVVEHAETVVAVSH